YRNIIITSYRSSYDPGTWFNMIVNEIDQSRPIMYLIDAHAIVCDGWRISGELNQYHMNYGWGGSYNAWYTVDNLHCAIENCNYLNESMQRLIMPDKRAMFTTDTTIGWVPFEVNFTGGTELQSVDGWNWDFGDGYTDNIQSPAHIYETGGVYDVELVVDSGPASYSYLKQKHIIALADTVVGSHILGPLDTTLDIVISVRNHVPLYRLQIPFEYGGDLTLKYMGMTSTGCRTDYFDDIGYVSYDGANKRFTLNFEAGSQPPLEAGNGPVIILRFQIDNGPANATNSIEMDGYGTDYYPMFYGELAIYTPALAPATVTYFYEGCCVGVTGDANCSGGDPDISDITRLIDYLYLSHAELCCPEEADVNASGGEPDISDITRLIDNLYLSYAPLPDCP
ncbi:MAG: C10 family peptidase, partial [Candidatus Zixiibacteriota bacterium]